MSKPLQSILFFIATTAPAWGRMDSLYIVTVNGDTLHGDAWVIQRAFSQDLVYLKGDSLAAAEVKVIRNSLGYFRHPSDEPGSEDFALRLNDGKAIDTYSKAFFIHHTYLSGASPDDRSTANAGDRGYGPWKKANEPTETAFVTYIPQAQFYSKHDQDLKKIDYANVKQDLWNSPASRSMIEIYESKRAKMWWFLAGGVASVLAPLPFVEDHPNAVLISSAGLVAIGISFYHRETRDQYIDLAVSRYKD